MHNAVAKEQNDEPILCVMHEIVLHSAMQFAILDSVFECSQPGISFIASFV